MAFPSTFYYLASPYSKYPDGLEAAFRDVCEQAGLLTKAGIPIFSPIAHTHPIAIQCGMDPLDHTIWLPADFPILDAACGMIFCKMKSWEKSYGMGVEKARFLSQGKPVYDMEPGVIPEALLQF